jgi:hypothetical protein
MKASIITFATSLMASAAVLGGAQAAQAHLLAGDGAVTSAKSTSSQSVLTVMQAAGIRYHAAANYRNEKRLTGTSYSAKSTGLRPDDKGGRRGV